MPAAAEAKAVGYVLRKLAGFAALWQNPRMITEELRSHLRTTPFQPFTVHLSDGKEIVVVHPDYAWLLPSGALLYVEDKDGKVHHISISHITHLTFDTSARVSG